MKEKINIKYIYKGECLGCEHLRRCNAFSETWYCQLQVKPNNNCAHWRDYGKKMKKCKHFKQYTEKRCIDCALAYSTDSSPAYWHCGANHKCFNYTEKACKHFNGSTEDYKIEQAIKTLQNQRNVLLTSKEEYLNTIKKIDEEICKIDKQIQDYGKQN